MPDTLEINGIKYQRVADHTNDCATELLLRIRRCGMYGYSKSAETMVSTALLAVLPPGVPPSFKRITFAHFVGSGKKRIAKASLEMFDGLSATVACWKYGDGWAHQWISIDGNDIFWNGQSWERVSSN